jgi:hypothetical protein
MHALSLADMMVPNPAGNKEHNVRGDVVLLTTTACGKSFTIS